MAIYELKLPELGEGLHEGRISKWLVQPGDTIAEDDAVAEVENDKSMVELPSPVEGKVVHLTVEEGTTAVVGDVLMTLEVAGEGTTEDAPDADRDTAAVEDAGYEKVADPSPQPVPPATKEDERRTATQTGPDKSQSDDGEAADRSKSAGGRESDSRGDAESDAKTGSNPSDSDSLASRVHETLATPGVRKFARDSKVDISRVKGTGANGKVTREDVEQFMKGGADTDGNAGATKSPAKPADGETAQKQNENQETKRQADSGKAASAGAAQTEEERIPLTSIRKIIADAMAKSMYTAPHVTVMDEVDVTELVKLRRELKPIGEERGVKITYLPFIVKAMIAAIRKYPHLNASLDDERQELVVKHNYHMGIATDTERGLMVPVVRDADRKSMWTIASEIADLASRARNNKLGPAEMRGSTISITNIGSAGGMFFTPVINYPEVAILGVGRITEKPVMKNGQVEGAQMMALSLSFDHRIIDGVMGQSFVNEVKRVLENPRLLMMEV